MEKLMNIRNRKGFTLVELLIVIIIIAILAAVVVPKFSQSSKSSKEAALRSDLKLYRNSIELFRADTGYYPLALADLEATSAPAQGKDSSGTSQNISASDWKGPYIDAVSANDPFGTAWSYSVTAGSVGKVKSATAGYTTW